ncbi:MAG: nitrogen fixation protein FixH [Cycloclasticus sp. symbiont of Bathymodiolus heckerae]|nr:MAG: nitrogen fixation protein FixH [Cycloclasticus sp. symbiont of Bathymodiolus heckerae]
MHKLSQDTLPWYKQFWPWFLILLPLSVVVASVVTFFIAQNNAPSLVSDNHYKEGLAINSNKQLEQRAEELGLSAVISRNSTAITVHLNGLSNPVESLQLKLRHATISQHDKSLTLTKIADGIYQTPFILPKPGKWYISIKGPSNSWEIKQVSQLR